MKMITSKDLFYIIGLVLGYIVMIISFLIAQRYKYNAITRAIGEMRDIIYGPKGSLNIVDQKTCKENRDQVFIAIRRTEMATEMIIREVKILNHNVQAIMFKMEIYSPPPSLEEPSKNED